MVIQYRRKKDYILIKVLGLPLNISGLKYLLQKDLQKPVYKEQNYGDTIMCTQSNISLDVGREKVV